MVINIKILILSTAYLINTLHDFHPHEHDFENNQEINIFSNIISHTDHDNHSPHPDHHNPHPDHHSGNHDEHNRNLPLHHEHFLQSHEYIQLRDITANSNDTIISMADVGYLNNAVQSKNPTFFYFNIEYDRFNSFILASNRLRAPPGLS